MTSELDDHIISMLLPPLFYRLKTNLRCDNIMCRPVRACIDTGATTTVMSLEKAKQSGLLSHVDTSIVGGVKGVGFAKILGIVHDAKIR